MDLRIENIYGKLGKEGLDGLLVTSPSNISYLTKFRSRDAYLLVSKSKNIYITDSRYTEEAKRNIPKGFLIRQIQDSVFKTIAKGCAELKLKRIGFESRHLTFAEQEKLKESLGKNGKLVAVQNLVEGLRQIKSEEELKKIKRAVEIAIAALQFIRDFISPGRRELEVAAELERFIRYNGAYASAFDIIVASGPNSSFAHHITSQRRIKNNEPVLVDMGVDYLGYKSDLTRVFFLGKITSTVRKIYDIVHQAQEKAIRAIKPDVFINKIDKVARQYITQRGYGGFFGHNTGHGVGLEVHESPYISPGEKERLSPGMVFTVEPAIYLPNRFGVRVEDMVLVTQKGVQLLSGNLHK